MSITIRSAKPSDASEIARVHVATWRTAYQGIVPQAYLDALDADARTARWEDELAKGDSYLFVAEEEGVLCGFIGGGMVRETLQDYDAEIYAIYVLAEAQQRGIGTRLVSALADALVQHGFARLAVWVLADNPACQFYASLGGVPFAEKQIEIGGAQLVEAAYGWQSIGGLGRQ